MPIKDSEKAEIELIRERFEKANLPEEAKKEFERELAKLERGAEIFITHLKPGEIELTMQEIEDEAGQFRPRMLQNNQVFDL